MSGLFLYNTNEYSGEYITEYKNKYEDIKDKFILPQIGDTLQISNPLGDIYKYIFLGFDYKKTYVKSLLNGKNIFINLKSNAKIKLYEDQYLNQDYIDSYFDNKIIPIMPRMHLNYKADSLSVFYHNIQNLEIISSNKARYLTFIGLAIDLFLWHNMEDSWGFGGGKMWKWE